MSNNSLERFSDRVQDYVRFRPRYPVGVLHHLEVACHLSRGSEVADLGSGTGFLAELFLENGHTVHGVEPNEPMRLAGGKHLSNYPQFHSVAGPAESTTLPPASVDLVIAGQAMHWFDRERTMAEIRRIGRGPCWFAAVTNDRDRTSTPLARDYEAILSRASTEYHRVLDLHRSLREWLEDPATCQSAEFPNLQRLDEEGLIGRTLSSSYAPKEGASHDLLVSELRDLFRAHSEDGFVTFSYRTRVELAALGGRAPS